MLLLITGGIGSGKSAYAAQWTMSLGKEAIRLTCPAIPGESEWRSETSGAAVDRPGFRWMDASADGTLAAKLKKINEESNIFRADSRVLLLDSLSGWIRSVAWTAAETGGQALPSAEHDLIWRDVLEELLSFQGLRVVVTEDACGGLLRDPWDRWMATRLAEGNRRLADASHAVYRLTAGMAAELTNTRTGRRI